MSTDISEEKEQSSKAAISYIWIYADQSELRRSDFVQFFKNEETYFICDYTEDGSFVASGFRSRGTKIDSISLNEAMKRLFVLPDETVILASNNGLAGFLQRQKINSLGKLRAYLYPERELTSLEHDLARMRDF